MVIFFLVDIICQTTLKLIYIRKFTLILTISILSIIIPYNLYAANISAGGSVWYAWYQPYGGQKIDPAFLYGPALSVEFNKDYNLTFVYYYGEYEHNYGRTSKQHDSDLALNYRLNDYFKIFTGIKYRKSVTNSNENSDPPVIVYGTKSESIGPGLGLSIILPAAKNTYLISTVSGLFLFKKTEYDVEQGIDDTKYYHNYDYNLTSGIAYYIAPASTVINLGGRYQCFIDRKDTSVKDYFYGITLTATYSFEI